MKAALSFSRLGAVYGISGQAVRQLSIRHGIDLDTLADPEALFEKLLTSGNRSPLRRRLVEPAERLRIATEISI